MAKKPLTVFRSVVMRSEALLDLHAQGAKIPEENDLIRAAVVLAVAGFDAYFTNKFCDILNPYLKSHKPGPTLIATLRDAGLDTEAALELAVMERPFRRIRTLVQRSLAGRTTQRFEAIDELFLSIGVKNLCLNAQKKTGYSNLNARVEALVLKRHDIAHSADLNSHANPREIDREKIRRRLVDLQRLVEACDDIIDAATKQKKKKT